MRERRLSLLLMGLGAVLAALGAALGQPAMVMAKAVRVCLECVGIG